MSQRDPDLEAMALARLRAALNGGDSEPADVDDDALMAVVEDADDDPELMRAIGASASTRAYLLGAGQPLTVERMTRALAGMAMAVEADPFAPSMPGVEVSGPFGRIRTAMHGAHDDGAPTAEPALFGPDSTLEWHVRGDDLPARFTLWLRPPGGRYRRSADPEVERSPSAARLTIAAARLFPSPGEWHVALVAGQMAPTDDGMALQETSARFDPDPIRLA